MKYFVLLTALLLFAGCDLFGTESGTNTITYRVESTSETPLITTAVNYRFGAGDDDIKGIETSKYPWELTLPYFPGLKSVVAFSNGEALTITILHNDQVIAVSSNEEISKEQAGHIIGAVAHAKSYVIETTLTGRDVMFSTNVFKSEQQFDLDFTGENGKRVVEDHRSLLPGDHLHIEKSAGNGLLEINLEQPYWVNLAVYGGSLPTTVDIHLGVAE